VGTLEVDTAEQINGKNTLLATPTSGVLTSGGSENHVNWPDHADWDFGTDDFTVEIHIRFDNAGTPRQSLIGHYNVSSTTGSWMLQYGPSGGSQLLSWWNGPSRLMDRTWVPNADQNYHLAISRVSGTTYMFIDGVQQGASVTDGTNYSAAITLAIGALDNNANANYFPMSGHVGPVRITKGVGRYSSGFTPPSTFYPTS
jgi:hypothetical protein